MLRQPKHDEQSQLQKQASVVSSTSQVAQGMKALSTLFDTPQESKSKTEEEMMDNLMMGYETQIKDLKEKHFAEAKALRDELRTLKLGQEETG